MNWKLRVAIHIYIAHTINSRGKTRRTKIINTFTSFGAGIFFLASFNFIIYIYDCTHLSGSFSIHPTPTPTPPPPIRPPLFYTPLYVSLRALLLSLPISCFAIRSARVLYGTVNCEYTRAARLSLSVIAAVYPHTTHTIAEWSRKAAALFQFSVNSSFIFFRCGLNEHNKILMIKMSITSLVNLPSPPPLLSATSSSRIDYVGSGTLVTSIDVVVHVGRSMSQATKKLMKKFESECWRPSLFCTRRKPQRIAADLALNNKTKWKLKKNTKLAPNRHGEFSIISH